MEEESKRYLVKKYRGENPVERQQMEMLRIECWHKAGFPVPNVYDKIIEGESEPYLVMEYIEGQTLGMYLRDQEVTATDKLTLLSRLFSHNMERHRLVLNNADVRFIHHDPNTGNILLRGSEFFFIDFEAGPKKLTSATNVSDLIGIEVAKFIRWSARDLGRNYLQDVLKLMMDIYSDTLIPKSIVNRVHGVPFQVLHRWKDKRKKARCPSNITKYDIADGIWNLSGESI